MSFPDSFYIIPKKLRLVKREQRNNSPGKEKAQSKTL